MYSTGILLLMVAFAGPGDDAADLVAGAERAFAQTSKEQGSVAAFQQWLADDAVLFRPKPVNGKAFYEKQEDKGNVLWWQPVHVTVARSGDMGLSTGPYVLRPANSDKAYYGHFLSVWEKQADGEWRVVLDAGNAHEPWLEETWPETVTKGVFGRKTAGSAGQTVSLAVRDRAYAKAAGEKGWGEALKKFAADDFRFYPPLGKPIEDHETAAKAVAELTNVSWEPEGDKAAKSGDFGYTYGTGSYEREGKQEAFVYMRIWRAPKGGEHQLIAELYTPLR